MLSATELRIGNYIDYTTKREIVTMQTTYEYIRLIHNGNKNFEPIPLTEEWLLKFGFEDKKTCFNLSKREELGHDFGDFAVSKYDDTQMKVWRGDRYIGGCHIQHVHQLQNLYFALTNEELTLIK
jgi:hypothetical protein